MQTAIRFIRPAGSVHGTFAPGDVLRCSDALAAHFVGLGAAVPFHPIQTAIPVANAEPEPGPKPKRQRKNPASAPA